MSKPGPANQRPDNLTVEQLPPWAQRAVGPMAAETGQHYGWYGGIGSLGLGCGSVVWSIPYMVGIGLLAWGVFGLRTDEFVVWRWAVGAVLAPAGAALSAMGARKQRRRGSGLILAPEGLVVVDGDAHRIAAREEIHEVRFDHGCVYVVYGPERRTWRQYSAPVGSKALPTLETRYHEIAKWLADGTPPADDRLPELAAASKTSPVKAALTGSAAAVGICLFFWLTAVLPSTSDAGRATRRFVGHIAKSDLDAAYQMMSSKRRAEMTREQFEKSLPAKLRNCSGIKVNSISGGAGTIAGSESCVDGWLNGVEGSSGFAFELASEGDDMAIVGWREGVCSRHP